MADRVKIEVSRELFNEISNKYGSEVKLLAIVSKEYTDLYKQDDDWQAIMDAIRRLYRKKEDLETDILVRHL